MMPLRYDSKLEPKFNPWQDNRGYVMSLSNEKKLTIALISAAGTGNYGDELIRKLWLQYYKSQSIIDISFSPVEKQVLTNNNYVHVNVSEIWEHKYSFSGVDLIHFLGGGYINDEFNTISKYTEALLLIKGNVPLIASGISLQPASLTNAILFLQHNWKLMGLRDSESFNQAKSILGKRASFSFDDTWKFSLRNILKLTKKDEKRLFICLQEQFNLEEEGKFLTKIYEIVTLINELRKSKPELIICVLEAHDTDTRLKQELEKVNVKAEMITAKEWLNEPIQFSKSDLLITSRFHPRLLFSRAGIPVKHIVVGNYYEQKHEDASGKIFFQSDTNLGSNFSSKLKGTRYSLLKLNCILRAFLFRQKLWLILQSIRIRKYVVMKLRVIKGILIGNSS
jgi:polysaccharide pyruvyl transferase WcaK-like protein